MAATMEEYQGWLEGTVDNHVKNTFEKAKTKLEDIMPYEKALVSRLYGWTCLKFLQYDTVLIFP